MQWPNQTSVYPRPGGVLVMCCLWVGVTLDTSGAVINITLPSLHTLASRRDDDAVTSDMVPATQQILWAVNMTPIMYY